MKGHFKLVALVLLITTMASSEGTCSSGTKSEKCTYVVNHSFCEVNLTPEDKEGKKTLEEVPTYAELKHDPKSNLPDSFTICSTIMDTNCHSEWFPLFFNLLDNQFETQVAPFLEKGSQTFVITKIVTL